MKWFKEVNLETNNIKLIPINKNYKNDLLIAASDGDLSELWFISVPTSSNIENYIEKAIDDFKQDKGLAFIVFDKKTNKIIRSFYSQNRFWFFSSDPTCKSACDLVNKLSVVFIYNQKKISSLDLH